jgi:hypothetical protein
VRRFSMSKVPPELAHPVRELGEPVQLLTRHL